MTQFNLDLINKWPTFGWPLSSTSIAALSVYAVGGFDPKLALDFIGNTYRTGGADSTLANSVTHARAGHATMVDSDGLLKWAPHNELPYSEDFSNSEWIKSNNGSVVVDNAVAPDGTTTAATLTIPQFNARTYQRVYRSYKAGDKITFSFWVRSDTVTSIIFGVGGGTNVANNNASANIVAPVTSTWNLVEFEITVLGNDTSLYFIIGWYSSHYRAQIGDVEIWHPHAYRSDLGGMVNNPTTGNSYVPTTSSAVYAPRVGHHIYNGNTWVNEGVLHESEARTNLLTHSEDFTNSNWVSRGFTKVGTVAGPLGTTGYEFLENNNNANPAIYYNPDVTDGTARTFSIWLKASSPVSIPLTTNSSTITTTINVTTDWQFFSCSDSVNTSNGPHIGGFSSITRGSGIQLYCAMPQMEAGSTPSSYIPTSGSTVTRAAETLTVPAANLPYSSTNMSIQMDGKMTYADNDLFPNTLGIFGDVGFLDWRNPTFDFISAGINTGASRLGEYDVYQRSTTSGVQVTQGATSDYSPDINVPFHIASIHSSTFIKGATEGTLTTSLFPTNQGLPDLSSTDLQLGSIFMGTIAQFRMWDEDLGDTGIATASSPSTEPSLQLTFDGSSTSSFTVLDWSE